jgi:iron complex transport system permease protein
LKKFIWIYIVIVIGSLFVGRLLINPFEPTALNKTILLDVRLPRIIVASLAGAGLSLAGLAFQNLFRNYLAGPNIVGVSSGAAFGAVLAILLVSFTPLVIQLSSFIFGIIAVIIAYKMSKLVGNGIVGLLLAGIAVSALFTSLIGMAKYMADPYDKLPTIVFWLLGSFSGIRWSDVAFLSPLILTGIIGIILLRWPFNILSLGDSEAQSLGMNVNVYRKIIIAFAALSVSSATAVGGIIGWIGLVSPHIARILVGYDNRKLVPASALVGASLLLFCDDIARSVIATELPLSVITSLIGAPLLIIILARRYRHAGN